jgi:hypothetical protein
MSTHADEQRVLRRARDEVRRSLALFDRLGEAWDSLLANEQEWLVMQAEAMAEADEERDS